MADLDQTSSRIAVVGDPADAKWARFRPADACAPETVCFLPPQELGEGLVPLGGPEHLQRAYRLLERLRSLDVREVHAREHEGLLFYAQSARRLGLASSQIRFVLHLIGPTLFRREQAGELPHGADDLELDFLEKCSVEWADEVVCDDPEILEWMSRRGWRIAAPASPPPAPCTPLVSVCLTHHDRPCLLRQAVESLVQQDYAAYEVILVDDGSRDVEAQRLLDELSPMFKERGWRILRQENLYLGAARNAAARIAKGEYLLFMDDDNVAKPHELSTLVACAQRSGAAIMAPLADFFEGDDPPGPTTPIVRRWLYSGAGPGIGAARNCFGDANALVRRDCFEAVGGFTQDFGVGREDWEFFAKAAIGGWSTMVVPAPLYWYRTSVEGMLRRSATSADVARRLRPFREKLPDWGESILEAYAGLEQQADARTEMIADLQRQVRALQEELQRRDLRLSQLRYRLADRLNAWTAKLPSVHRRLKRFFGG